MTLAFRELRYVRCKVDDIATTADFAEQMFGMMCEGRTETGALFRADKRFYSLWIATDMPSAIGFSVGRAADLDEYAKVFEGAGHDVTWLEGDDASRRIIKRGISVPTPNGVRLEIVWRHMESGQPFHGGRHTGLNGFSAVQLACADIDANTAFWENVPGLDVSDYAGKAQFMTIGGSHHQIALYPSDEDGVLGATWQVETLDNVMRHWHYMRDRQVPIAHGPGRQPTSDAVFLSLRTPAGFLMSYATEMSAPPELGPRQFRDEARSHCQWGSPTEMPEFKGERS